MVPLLFQVWQPFLYVIRSLPIGTAQYYDGVLALTMHVIGDLNSSEGIKLIQEALKFVVSRSMDFIHRLKLGICSRRLPILG